MPEIHLQEFGSNGDIALAVKAKFDNATAQIWCTEAGLFDSLERVLIGCLELYKELNV